MDPITIISLVLPPVILTFFISRWMSGKEKALLDQQKEAAIREADLLRNELLQERGLLAEEKEEKSQAMQRLAALETEYKLVRQRLDDYTKDLAAQDERFKNLAQQVLEEKSHSFDVQQKKGIQSLLEPLQERIKAFEEKVEKTNHESIQRHTSLKEQISYLHQQSERVSKDANNLARALKGDYQKQGAWGELILESILDKSGLVKDREYFTQDTQVNEEGRRQRPDVVIALPDGKKLIIDSKVSLNAYQNMVNAEIEEDADISSKAHLLAVRNHVDTLSAKNYQDLYEMESPDFVLMFIPIDTAFSAALARDNHLYQYAFDKNVVIVTPSTLLATLKTVETMWRNDKQNRYALEIAGEAGKMYDKFVGFVDDMEKMGKQMDTAKNTYNSAIKKLSTGSGNLVGRAEKIKALGAKAHKKLNLSTDEDDD